jgi:hypothetical protein
MLKMSNEKTIDVGTISSEVKDIFETVDVGNFTSEILVTPPIRSAEKIITDQKTIEEWEKKRKEIEKRRKKILEKYEKQDNVVRSIMNEAIDSISKLFDDNNILYLKDVFSCCRTSFLVFHKQTANGLSIGRGPNIKTRLIINPQESFYETEKNKEGKLIVLDPKEYSKELSNSDLSSSFLAVWSKEKDQWKFKPIKLINQLFNFLKKKFASTEVIESRFAPIIDKVKIKMKEEEFSKYLLYKYPIEAKSHFFLTQEELIEYLKPRSNFDEFFKMKIKCLSRICNKLNI